MQRWEKKRQVSWLRKRKGAHTVPQTASNTEKRAIGCTTNCRRQPQTGVDRLGGQT